MRASTHQGHIQSESNNHRAQLAKAYQELGKDLSSSKFRVIGNYTLGKVIGEGTYGKVRIGTHRLTGTRVAIKQIPKEVSAQLTREIHHHRRLHHPHVTKLYEVIATETSIWLITELCSGGELFDYLVEKGRLSEDETRRLVGQLCLALHYVHSNGAVHRDLKLENVLLDDRCNVKIGDFGFTREYEQGRLLETFCGTTGYAAPEMLLAERYSGPEVDIWSLGIILYTLLAGSLPFDDDDEKVMKDKIIQGQFDIPDSLSDNAQALLRGMLKRNPTERLTIPAILRHPWFTRLEFPQPLPSPPLFTLDPEEILPPDIHLEPPESLKDSELPLTIDGSESSSNASDAPYYSASSDVAPSDSTNITTPDLRPSLLSLPTSNAKARPVSEADTVKMERSWSQSTIGVNRVPVESSKHDMIPFAAVPEEDDTNASKSLSRANSSRSRNSLPPSFSSRTPIRTKRRSVTSNISPPSSPVEGPGPLAEPPETPDYGALINATAPIMFSTPLERNLLNDLSALGFDTGQIVHSVLSNACDASGAIWWLLKKKAERREAQEARRVAEERRKTLEALDQSNKRATTVNGAAVPAVLADESFEASVEVSLASVEASTAPYVSAQEPSYPPLPPAPQTPVVSREGEPQNVPSPPHISFVPATPTHASIVTDPEQTRSDTVTPNSSVAMLLSAEDLTVKSVPASPSTLKDKRSAKNRSGSVSMLQRGLGLVRKKSEEKVKEREREKEKGREREKEKEKEEMANRPSESASSGSPLTLPTLSHSASFPSGTTKITKSPPGFLKKHEKEADDPLRIPSVLTPDSPWVATTTSSPPLSSRPTFKFVPSMSSSSFLSTHEEHETTNVFSDSRNNPQSAGKGRGQRTSLLSTFKTWFQEDKRKWRNKIKPVLENDLTGGPYFNGAVAATPSSARPNSRNTLRSRKKIGARRHDKRPSISSKRSSSVNSRRSSVNSVQHLRGPDFTSMPPVLSGECTESVSRQRSSRSRRSIGSRTPTSEIGSRPSSIRSFTVGPMPRPGHRPRTPSQSSVASSRVRRADRSERIDSPLQQFHRRAGSGSSARVVRQHHPVHNHSHRRTDSVASSIKSNPKNDSAGEVVSDSEQAPSASPLRRSASGSSSALGDPNVTPTQRKPHTTLYVAHRQGNVFGAPASRNAVSLGRLSWKKSWGHEPPGWQSRAAAYMVTESETASETGHGEAVRDVFYGRQSLDPDDDSDWVDEDDDVPTFVGGVGQLPTPTNPAQVLSSPAVTSLLSSGLPPSPSMRSKRELPPVFSTGRPLRPLGTHKNQRVRPIASPPPFTTSSSSSESNPRSPPSTSGVTTSDATMRTSPIPPLLQLSVNASTPDREQSPSPEMSMTGSSSRSRRQLPGGRNGPFPRGPTIQEEDEEEET